MSVERLDFNDNPDEQLADRWLADLRAHPDFRPQDEYILARVRSSDRATSMFASQQKLRQQRLDASGGSNDVIGDQLRMLRDVFGHS